MVLETLQEASMITLEDALDPDLRAWSFGIPTNGTFILNNQQTYLMLLSDLGEWKSLNLRWNRMDSEQCWETRW